MTSNATAEAIARALASVTTFRVLSAVYLGPGPGNLSRVRIPGETDHLDVHSTNLFEPIVGDEHWLFWSADFCIMWGPRLPREKSGTVDTITPSPNGTLLFTVRTDRGTVYRDLRAYLPAIRVRDETGRVLTVEPGYDVGDTVSINWNLDGGVIDGLFTGDDGRALPSSEPLFAPTAGAAEFRASWVGDWNGTAWQSPAVGQVWASTGHTVFAGYGSRIADTLPDLAHGISASIYLSPAVTGATGYPQIGVHAAGSRPGTAPAFTVNGPVNGSGGWVQLTTEQAQILVLALRANAGGVALVSAGSTTKLRDLAADDLTMALRIGWST